MESTIRGSFRLFRLAGVQVYLHWSWFLVAIFMVQFQSPRYRAPGWAAAEYVALFAVVLLHEFGHALACRSVGGRANRIVLWPLGGIAFVRPPPRPGAVLWSIAAGPLVNVLLIPVTLALVAYGTADGTATVGRVFTRGLPDPDRFLGNLFFMNAFLLGFNLLPVYPLDGGQILQAVLWFGIGPWRSLLVVSLTGLLFGGVALPLTLYLTLLEPGAVMLCVLAAFVLLRSFAGLQYAQHALHMQALPRHTDAVCPTCHTGGPRGPFWVCEHCETRFDTFQTHGACPACGAWYHPTACPHCGQAHRVEEWYAAASAASGGREPPVAELEQGAHAPRSPA